ncbi:hypothetical protein ACFC18_55500, partial [Streptomyces sp. NPDC056121]
SRRLGLFVVNRLAERQQVDVTLRRSVYGGVTAVVFVPQQLLEAPHPGLRPLPEPPALESGHEPAPAPFAVPVPASQHPEQQPVPRPEGEPEPPLVRTTPRQEPTHARHAAPRPAPPLPARSTEAPSGPDSDDGLPRRVRQASLAPELRDDENTSTASRPDQAPAVRSPEAARATMASLRSGRRRASAAQGEPGTPPGPAGTSGASHAAPHPHHATEEGSRNR